MGYEDVDVTLRLRAIDETDRVMADAARRAKSTTDAMVRGMSDIGKATLEASRTTQKLTEGLTAAGRATQQFATAASNVSAMTKAMGDYNISTDRMARGMAQAGQAAAQAAQAAKGFHTNTSLASSIVKEATGTLLKYAAGFTTVTGAIAAVNRGFTSFAEGQRGMDRIQLDTKATADQMEHLGKTIGALKSITGESGTALRQNFSAFREQTGLAFDDAEKLFNRIALASHAAGTNFEDMSRSAVAAITNFKVPQEEVSAMLDTWVKTIPSSMMSTFAQAAPRITQLLHGIGYSGKESAEGVASAFANLAVKLGNARLATSVLEDIFTKATDINSALGMQTVPMIQRVLGKPDEFKNSWEAIYKVVKQSGIFDTQDLAQKSMIRQMLGLDDRTIEAIKAQHDEIEKIDRVAKRLGLTYGEVDGRIKVLNGGAQRTLDTIAAATEKIYTAIGKLFNLTQIPNKFGETLAKDASDLERMVYWTERLIKLLPGGGKPAAGGAAETTLGPVGKVIDPALDFIGGPGQSKLDLIAPLLNKMGIPIPTSEQRATNREKYIADRQKQEEEDRKAAAHDEEIKAELKKEEDAKKAAEDAKKKASPPSGRRTFATGGEFTVPGSGRADDVPVNFLATPGERVTVASVPEQDRKESLQKQQDKADIALREHFARFHGKSRPGAQIGSGWPHDRLAALGGSAGSPTGSTGGGGDGTGSSGGGGGDGKTPPGTQDGTTPPAGPPTSGPGYNIGPYGQPMPEWGTHVTEGEDWGGGTGGGVAGGVPGLPGGPSGRALTKEERAAQAAGGGVTTTGGSVDYSPGYAGGKAPAATRFNNPGGMYPSAITRQYGSIDAGTKTIGGGHPIAQFPHPEHGSAANMEFARKHGLGKTVGQLRWYHVHGNWNGSMGLPGTDSNHVITSDDLKNNQFMSTYTQSVYAAEGRKAPLTPQQLNTGFDMYQAGGVKQYEATRRTGTSSTAAGAPAVPGTTGAGAPQSGGDTSKLSDQDKWIAQRYNGHGWTWKDDQAAAKAGLTRDQYVVGGMDPRLRQAMYEQGVKYEKETGKKFEFTSGFRDDYRQSLITSGVHAPTGYSHHGGSKIDLGGTGTGGMKNYGYGGAFDSTPEFGAWIKRQGSGTGIAWTGEHISGDPYHVSGAWTREAGKWKLKMTPQQLAALEQRVKEAQLADGKTRVAGPIPTPDTKPDVPKFVPGQTQGLPGTPSGPAVRRPKGPDAPHSTTLPDHDPGGLQDATPSRSAASAASAARRTAAAKSIAAATPKAAPAADPAAKAIAKGKAVAGELAEGGTAGAGQDVLVGEDGPEVLSMGPRSGTVWTPEQLRALSPEHYAGAAPDLGTGASGRTDPASIGPFFGSDLDAVLQLAPGGPAMSAGKSAGAALLGKLGGMAGKWAGGQVEHQLTREGLEAGHGVLGQHRQFEDRLDQLRRGSSGSQIQPIDQANADMRSSLGAPIEPVIRPRIQQTGPLSMRWTRQSERQRHTDISRDQARTAHTDQGFA